MYYIGIDGGGTYSRLIAVDEDLKVVGRHVGNSTNMQSNSYAVVMDNITKLVQEFNTLTNTRMIDCAAVCIGSAGIDIPENAEQMKKLFREIGFGCKVRAVNDAELILATETKGQPGVAIISGTGSIGYAIDKNGKASRAGGWGYLIDDGGSGYRIGMEAIRYALMAFDGRGESTALTKKINEHFNIKQTDDVLKYIYNENFNKSQIAELAMLVKYASSENDAVAKQIEDNAADDLVKLAEALMIKNQLFEHKIVLSGSVILLNDNIRDRFTNTIKKKYQKMEIVSMKDKPEMGAVYLAMNEIHKAKNDF